LAVGREQTQDLRAQFRIARTGGIQRSGVTVLRQLTQLVE
jgi:hypothetical protein